MLFTSDVPVAKGRAVAPPLRWRAAANSGAELVPAPDENRRRRDPECCFAALHARDSASRRCGIPTSAPIGNASAERPQRRRRHLVWTRRRWLFCFPPRGVVLGSLVTLVWASRRGPLRCPRTARNGRSGRPAPRSGGPRERRCRHRWPCWWRCSGRGRRRSHRPRRTCRRARSSPPSRVQRLHDPGGDAVGCAVGAGQRKARHLGPLDVGGERRAQRLRGRRAPRRDTDGGRRPPAPSDVANSPVIVSPSCISPLATFGPMRRDQHPGVG